MADLDQMQRQINTLLGEVKTLKNSNSEKDRVIELLKRDIHKLQNEFGSLRKKTKGDVQRIESKVSSIRR